MCYFSIPPKENGSFQSWRFNAENVFPFQFVHTLHLSSTCNKKDSSSSSSQPCVNQQQHNSWMQRFLHHNQPCEVFKSEIRFSIFFLSSMRMSTTRAPNMEATFHHHSISNVIINFIKILFSCQDFTLCYMQLMKSAGKIKEDQSMQMNFPTQEQPTICTHQVLTLLILGLAYLFNMLSTKFINLIFCLPSLVHSAP